MAKQKRSPTRGRHGAKRASRKPIVVTFLSGKKSRRYEFRTAKEAQRAIDRFYGGTWKPWWMRPSKGHPVPKRLVHRCSTDAQRRNVRHLYHYKAFPPRQAVAASISVLKRDCGCGPVQKKRMMTPGQIVSRCPR